MRKDNLFAETAEFSKYLKNAQSAIRLSPLSPEIKTDCLFAAGVSEKTQKIMWNAVVATKSDTRRIVTKKRTHFAETADETN